MGFGTCVPDNAVSVLYLCCPMSFQLSLCSHFADRKHHVVQPCFLLLQLYHGQFLLSVHSVQNMLSAVFCSEAAKRQNTKKRIYSSNNRGSGKVETADSPWNFGQIFPTDHLWKVSGKVESFFSHGKSGKFVEWKTKVCGKNRGKPAALKIPLPQAVENTFHSFLPQIPQARSCSC